MAAKKKKNTKNKKIASKNNQNNLKNPENSIKKEEKVNQKVKVDLQKSENKVNDKNKSNYVELKANNKKIEETNVEKIIFKNKKVENSKKALDSKDKKNDNKSDIKNEKNNINSKKYIEEKNNKKRKIMFMIINIIIILFILFIFSTIFAFIHTTKTTIARGVSVKDVDLSNLTYDEAKEKLEEAFDVILDVNIEFIYKDYKYIMKSDEISLAYELKNLLDEAYNVGRSGNIIQNNFELIQTAIFKKNIEFNYLYNEEEVDKVVDYIATSVPDLVKQYSYYRDENQLIINPGVDGIKVNKKELKKEIIENIEKRNPLIIVNDYKNEIVQIPYEEELAEEIDIEKIYNEVYSEPQDAYYIEETENTKFAIYPDVDGVDFSKEEAQNIINEKGLNEYVIPLKITKANVTIKQIGIEAFPYTVSTFSTTYDASNTSRSENLKIAARKIDGTVLLPGEQFSFNGVVGERTVAEGYKDAKIFSDGQVVDGLAGGICQISSTLYNAAVLANLQIDERYNHSFTTSYVAAGRDATVVYGVKDFKFTNTRQYPIKIDSEVSNGVAKFIIYGIEEENEVDVKIIPVTTDTIPYTVQTVTDPSLAPGAVQVSQAGASGYKVTTYKEVYLNGAQISREVLSNDVYKVMTRILKVGPEATAPVVSTPIENLTEEAISVESGVEETPLEETPSEEIPPVELPTGETPIEVENNLN